LSDEFLYRLHQATPRTWVTPTIVAINVAVWLLNVALGVPLLSPSGAELLAWGGNRLAETHLQPWRLFSATVLHAGIIHLAFNMWALWDVGRLAERFYGNAQFFLIYLWSGLFGSLASLFFAGRTAVSVGASGAIFGVVGALLAAIFTKHSRLPAPLVKPVRNSLLTFVGFSLFLGFTSGVVDNAAHLGGLAAGFGLALIMAERFDWTLYRRQGLARALIAMVVAAALALTLWRWLGYR
jgi:rhomboid protease GluP